MQRKAPFAMMALANQQYGKMKKERLGADIEKKREKLVPDDSDDTGADGGSFPVHDGSVEPGSSGGMQTMPYFDDSQVNYFPQHNYLAEKLGACPRGHVKDKKGKCKKKRGAKAGKMARSKKGARSKTHPGRKDYTTKRGNKYYDRGGHRYAYPEYNPVAYSHGGMQTPYSSTDNALRDPSAAFHRPIHHAFK